MLLHLDLVALGRLDAGGRITRRPRLMAFCRKMRAKLLATTISSWPFRQDTACSREEPQPKFLPATMTLPGGISFALSRALKSGVVGERELRRLARQHGGHVAAGIDDVGGDVVAEPENHAVPWLRPPFAGR